jgi:hypothetical protein
VHDWVLGLGVLGFGFRIWRLGVLGFRSIGVEG